MKQSVSPIKVVENKIFIIRGHKVMLDRDLAELYQVPTKVLIQAIKRNKTRFPKDFMFQITSKELENLRSQIVTSSWGGRRYLPYVFNEHGVAMLSTVLNSERAIQVNIAIIRTFVKLREMVSMHTELMNKLNKLEEKVGKHDKEIEAIFDAIRQMTSPPQKPKGKIGFYKE